MESTIKALYDVILDRRENPSENSYTRYLFDEGMDKILKKVAEESGETIIAAKNGELEPLCGEVCDLIYHLLVMCVEAKLPLEDIFAELDKRAGKTGNLKPKTVSDHNT